MTVVSDQDLLLFHCRDGLDSNRLAEIEDALFLDASLRQRLAALRELLSAAGESWRMDEADAGLEARVWARLEPALPRRQTTYRTSFWRNLLSALWQPRLGFAAMLMIALAVGFLLGQRPAADVELADQRLLAADASSRVLASYMAAHLRDTERAFLVAVNSPGGADAAPDVAATLLESNRLYAIAAQRGGRPALAQYLREIEPVLIELANAEGSITPALSAEIRQRDLAFKSRAAAVVAQQTIAPGAHSL